MIRIKLPTIVIAITCIFASACNSDEPGNALCGNGIVDTDEACDDGNDNDNDDCLTTCQMATCGDGFTHNQGTGAEQCDDGNASDNDDCLTACQWATCGDGFTHNRGMGTEQCDDGNDNDNDDCLTICQNARCGDGFTHNQGVATEECDDGNSNDNDDCLTTCQVASCGDGFIHDQGMGTEQCDDGNGSDSDDCLTTCATAMCGDGFIHDHGTGTEQCDDGNGNDNDNCLTTCQIASCGDGFVHNQGTGTEQCDDGNSNENDDCLATCQIASCGDGFVHNQGTGIEQCDDGNSSESDDCLTTCEAATCGDGFIHNQGTGIEQCDDGDSNDSDDCPTTCMNAYCGDGFQWNQGMGNEVCDDGNLDDSDDCTVLCEAAACDDGLMNADELDIDCAGHCGVRSCHGGQMCANDTDCFSNSCVAGLCEAHDDDVATGHYHTCALTSLGAVRCWGSNSQGQLGRGHTTDIGDDELPSSGGPVNVGGAVVQLAAGAFHTCVLMQSGAVRCWGRNDYGQLGYGHTNDIGDNEVPATAGDVSLGAPAVQVVAGYSHTCALMQSGAVRCWGHNVMGQLGYGYTQHIGDSELPSSVDEVGLGGVAVFLAAGAVHTCAILQSGAVRCWGRNNYGQLGYGHTDRIGDDELPASAGDISLGGLAASVSAGDYFTCAVLQSGAVRCWGRNNYGQLGYGNITDIGDDELPDTAGPVMLGDMTVQLITGSSHSCARLQGGGVRCWGQGGSRLGYGNYNSIGDDELPTSVGLVSIGGVVKHLAEGRNEHTCVRLQSGGLRCWGRGSHGQLGYGNIEAIGDNELPSSVGEVPYE